MNAHLRMIGQKVVDEFGFMGREIVSDDMDLESERLGGHHVGEKASSKPWASALPRERGRTASRRSASGS